MTYVLEIMGGPDDGLEVRSDSPWATHRCFVHRILEQVAANEPGTTCHSYSMTCRPMAVEQTSGSRRPVLSCYVIRSCQIHNDVVRVKLDYIGWELPD